MRRKLHSIDASISDARKTTVLVNQLMLNLMGRRPTLVDSLPMLRAAPRRNGLYFNFGHQHIGLSMGPGSGQVITALLKKETPPIDITPFAPERFPI